MSKYTLKAVLADIRSDLVFESPHGKPGELFKCSHGSVVENVETGEQYDLGDAYRTPWVRINPAEISVETAKELLIGRFTMGIVREVHCIGGYQIIECQNKHKGGELVEFVPYVDWEELNLICETMDEALACAISHRNTGSWETAGTFLALLRRKAEHEELEATKRELAALKAKLAEANPA